MTATTIERLREQYGQIAEWTKGHSDRIHIEGFRGAASGPAVSVMADDKTGTLYLVICLDPMSPLGEVYGRYCVPFVPDPDFHLDKAHLWIYPEGEDEIKLEVRVSLPRRFADAEGETLEMVYGVKVKAQDCHHLRK